MRCYQEVGLTAEARTWLKENVKMISTSACPKCGEVLSTGMDCKVYEDVDSFYGDGPHLQKYNLKDGGVVKEVVQLEPWSSGPMAFFCLEKDGKRMFEWTNEEVNGEEQGLCEDNKDIAE